MHVFIASGIYAHATGAAYIIYRGKSSRILARDTLDQKSFGKAAAAAFRSITSVKPN